MKKENKMKINEKIKIVSIANEVINTAVNEIVNVCKHYPINIVRLKLYLDVYRFGIETIKSIERSA